MTHIAQTDHFGPSPFASANSFLFLVHSAGVFPWLSSYRRKSFIRTQLDD